MFLKESTWNRRKLKRTKLMLNSFCGKFGQRNNLSQTEYVSDPDKFFAKMDDVKTKVSSVQFFGQIQSPPLRGAG